jgi:hypothetical protein
LKARRVDLRDFAAWQRYAYNGEGEPDVKFIWRGLWELNIVVKYYKNLTVNLVLIGRTYKAQLKNQQSDSSKYKRSTDIVQIRYNPSSEIAVELRKIYSKSYQYLREHREIICKRKQTGL